MKNEYESIVKYDLSSVQKYSYSKLKTYITCPLLYYKTYVEGVRGMQNGYGMAGHIAHTIIEEYYKDMHSAYELDDVFKNRWQTEFVDKGWDIKLKLPNFTRSLSSKYYDDYVEYFSTFTGYENCEILNVEDTFLMLLSHGDQTILYNGVIDAIGRDDNGIIIWDSKSKSAWKNDKERDSYFVQLYTYALYVKEIYGEYPYKLAINQFRNPLGKRITYKDFNIADFNDSIKWVFDTVTQIENEVMWLPNEDPFFCKNLCGHYPCEIHEGK